MNLFSWPPSCTISSLHLSTLPNEGAPTPLSQPSLVMIYSLLYFTSPLQSFRSMKDRRLSTSYSNYWETTGLQPRSVTIRIHGQQWTGRECTCNVGSRSHTEQRRRLKRGGNERPASCTCAKRGIRGAKFQLESALTWYWFAPARRRPTRSGRETSHAEPSAQHRVENHVDNDDRSKWA